ncbi:MAG: hypothetical protein EPO24_08520 [Bacteroidetes bacterium]|nr:MAG: hypothetical protein EPO24_08520 [Bacteroidota bacterium]
MRFITLILLFSFLLLTGCQKDDDNSVIPPLGTTTSYTGAIAGESESGSISFTINGSTKVAAREYASPLAILTVTGTIKLADGTTITLNGTFNTETDSIYVSGGGYSFAGELSNGSISGTYTGPNGTGAFSVQAGAQATVKVYCGTYVSYDNSSSGILNLSLKDTTMTGLAISLDSGDKTFLYGTISGTAITIYDSQHQQGVATGILNGATASGTYDAGDDEGTWTATLVDSIRPVTGNPFTDTKWIGFEDDGDSLRMELTATTITTYKRQVGQGCWEYRVPPGTAYTVTDNVISLTVDGTPLEVTFRIFGNVVIFTSIPPGEDGRNWTKVQTFATPLTMCP